MEIIELKEMDNVSENVKLSRLSMQFKELLEQLKQRKLPDKIIDLINQAIEELNSTSLMGNDLRRLLQKKQAKILKLLEKELKIVPKNHYKNLWLAVGPSVFGFPTGLAISSSFANNWVFFLIGIPIGLVIGMSIGLSMDKKAYKEGRQLDVYIKY